MTATLNGMPIASATIVMPRIGLWTAVASVDTAGAVIGQATLEVDGQQLVGVAHGEQYLGRFDARVTAGAGGLSQRLPAKAYRGVPLRLPLTDALTEAGEQLSETASGFGLGTLLLHWVRVEGPAVWTLTRLGEEAVFAWRVLPDGTIWCGDEAWPESSATYDLLRDVPETGAALVASASGLVLPGTLVEGRRVSRVEHTIKASQTRSMVWFEA